MRPRLPRFLCSALVLGALLAASALGGCGHPASVAECEEIVDRIARLELKQRVGALGQEEVVREVDRTKRELRETTMKDCVGKRITDKAMRCVRAADSSKAIIEDCFD